MRASLSLTVLLCGIASAASVEVRETPRPFAELPVAPGLTLPAAAFDPLTRTPVPAAPSAAAPLPALGPAAKGPEPVSASANAALAIQEPSISFDGTSHGFSRAVLLAQRAATLPAHIWPFTTLAKKLSHGEGLAGLTPSGAVAAAERIRADHGAPSVVGRLSWELHDIWSVRGAVKSYASLIDAVAEAKAKDPALDVAVSLDVEALGAQLDGLTLEERTRVAKANAVALARRARDRGVPVEFDMGASSLMPLLVEVARSVVRELGMPARLALAARYLASEGVLRDWAALARATGLKLGVRLVKGSFIEGDREGTLYLRRGLLDQYKKLITMALGEHGALDVAVATQNEEIWEHAQRESQRLGTDYSLQVIRGVNRKLQRRMRASGSVPREYVSYGVDTPVMAVMEWWTNWRQKRALRRRQVVGELD